MTVSSSSARPGRLSRFGPLPALAAATLLASLGISVATVALPRLGAVFGVSLAASQWVLLVYLLSVTTAIVSAGRLGDLLGQRRVLLAGLGLFAAASALCAAAPGFAVLLAGRIGQGLAAAALMSLPVSLVRDTVTGARTGSAMGLLGTMSAIGTALGPSLGGVTLAAFGWRAIFAVLAAAALGALILAARSLPEGRERAEVRAPRFDLAGSAVLGGALAAYALAMTLKGSAAVTAGLLLAAVAGIALFLRVEARAAVPLVSLSTLSDRRIASGLAGNALVTTVMMSTLVVGPFYLAFRLMLSEAPLGLVLAVGPATAALAGVPAGRLTDRIGAGTAQQAGVALAIAGLVLLALLPPLAGVPGYVVALIVLTPGFQLFLAGNNTMMMLAARDDERGAVSGMMGLSRNLGFVTGASAMGSLFALAAGRADPALATPGALDLALRVTFLAAAGLLVVAWRLTAAARR